MYDEILNNRYIGAAAIIAINEKSRDRLNCTPNVRQNIRGVFMSKYSFEEKCEAVQRVLDGLYVRAHEFWV